jgi:hypothetical protein
MLWSLAIGGIAALAVFISTTSVVVLQREENAETKNEFERYKTEAGIERTKSDERIAELKTESDKARAAIAGAEERAKVAGQRAAEAQLELERMRAPRNLSNEAIERIADKLKSFAGIPFLISMPVNWEAGSRLPGQVFGALHEAGWVYVKSSILPAHPTLPTFSLNTGVVGVRVTGDIMKPGFKEALNALEEALNAEGIITSGEALLPLPNNGDPIAINVAIGTKT